FALKDKSQEQAERKILPKIDAERLLADDLLARRPRDRQTGNWLNATDRSATPARRPGTARRGYKMPQDLEPRNYMYKKPSMSSDQLHPGSLPARILVKFLL